MKTVSTTHRFFSLTLATVAAGALLVGAAGLGTAQAGTNVKIYPGTMCELYQVTKAPEKRTNAYKNKKGAVTKKRPFTKRAKTKKRPFTETGSSAPSVLLYQQDASISNISKDLVTTVRCPIIRDMTTNGNGLRYVSVNYVDQHDRLDPLCFVVSRSLKDNKISNRSYGKSRRIQRNYWRSVIEGPKNSSHDSMFYTLYCAIPPKRGTYPPELVRSRLLNYEVAEGDD